MLTIKNFIVYPCFSLDFLYLTFDIEDTTENLNNYQFNIYRSEGSDDFILLDTDLTEFYYIDKTVNLYKSDITYVYKLEIKDKQNGQITYMTTQMQPKPDLYAQAIISSYEIYLKNVINQEMLLLKRKKSGQLCFCYDDIRKRSTVVDCQVCYNTTYIGGYYNPQKIYVNIITPKLIVEQFSPIEQVTENNILQLWTLGFPPISINDVLIDRLNNRYIVISCQQTYKNNYILRQQLQIQKIPQSNIIYKLPINEWR